MELFILFAVLFASCNGEVRIAGGEETTIGQFPFAAALLNNYGADNTFQQACGGTVITTTAVLSSGTCFQTEDGLVEPSRWRVRLGSSYSNSGGTVYFIRSIALHPDFQGTTRQNNVAVLRTSVAIVLQPGLVEVARLAGGAYTFNTSVNVTAIGWGDATDAETPSDQLRHVGIWPVDQNVCTQRYAAIGVEVTDSIVCVGWIDVGVRGQCPGDDGSPLVDNQGIVVGVFSWAQGCADLWFPGLNSRVSSYINWIISAAIA